MKRNVPVIGIRFLLFYALCMCILWGCAVNSTDVPKEYEQQLKSGKIISIFACEQSVWLSEDEKYLLEVEEESVNLICKYQGRSICFTLSEMQEDRPGTYWYHTDDELDKSGVFWGNVQQNKFVCYEFPAVDSDGTIDQMIFHREPKERSAEVEKSFFASIRPTKKRVQIDKQISVIAQNVKQWLQQDQELLATKYMVSDFNQDGILELVSYIYIENFYVDIQIWEVDVSDQELVDLNEDREAYVPQIDMEVKNTSMYFEQKKGIYCYIFAENPIKKSQNYQVVAYQDDALVSFGEEQSFLREHPNIIKYDVTFGWFSGEGIELGQGTDKLEEVLLKSYREFGWK